MKILFLLCLVILTVVWASASPTPNDQPKEVNLVEGICKQKFLTAVSI